MVAESDADEVQRDREHRQAAQRRLIDGERERRRAEIARLQAFSAKQPSGSDEAAPPRPRPTSLGSSNDSVRRPFAEAKSPGPEASVPSPTPARSIGAPIHSESLREFLEVDPAERFDLQTLNRLRTSGIVHEVADDPALLAEISRRAAALMGRVKQEVDDPITAGAFLREQVLDWYRHSPADPGWSARSAGRWAGIFADSRASGGRRLPWLNTRLEALRDGATRAGRLPGRLRRGILRDRRPEQTLSRTPSQQIQAEVAQALLDDLSERPRDPETPHPLVRLSELAVRRQVATVCDSLARLFGSPESGPFVLLHPNRYPECDEMVIRPPISGASGAALAFALAPGRPTRRAPVRLSLSVDGVAVAGSPSTASTGSGDLEGEIDASTIWESEAVGRATWVRVLEERRRDRRRLDPPPRDFRTRPAYASLKELVLGDVEFRKALLAAKWRGRPTGLPLLVALLQKGRLAPDVATDHEYLEAELAEWADPEPPARPDEGVWSVGGWTVRREGPPGAGSTYRADRARDRRPPEP